jgi:hypothetical protein
MISGILSLVSGLIRIGSQILDYIEKRELIQHGKTEKTNENLLRWKKKVDAARRARSSVGSDNGVHPDPNRRD